MKFAVGELDGAAAQQQQRLDRVDRVGGALLRQVAVRPAEHLRERVDDSKPLAPVEGPLTGAGQRRPRALGSRETTSPRSRRAEVVAEKLPALCPLQINAIVSTRHRRSYE
ncbi:MAG TPA: hypothetical protein VF912_04655 [Anaeromyxobacter sp.]